MKRLLFLCILTILSIPEVISAQSADRITQILDTDAATYGQAAYITAVYKELVTDTASGQESVNALAAAGILKKNIPADKLIPLGDLALLCGQATGMKGGLWYSIHPSARYALRQLKADALLPASADPSMIVTGRDTLNLFNSCIRTYTYDKKGAEK